MKNQRIARVINFFAFNLLFFALYLNFIHQDANTAVTQQNAYGITKHTTILAGNQAQDLNQTTENSTDQTFAVHANKSKRTLN